MLPWGCEKYGGKKPKEEEERKAKEVSRWCKCHMSRSDEGARLIIVARCWPENIPTKKLEIYVVWAACTCCESTEA
jgi:hypothetical protein